MVEQLNTHGKTVEERNSRTEEEWNSKPCDAGTVEHLMVEQ